MSKNNTNHLMQAMPPGPKDMYNRAEQAANHLRSRYRVSAEPKVMVVLGTGCGDVAKNIDGERIDNSQIPNMPLSTVEGHAGKTILGKYGGKEVIAFQGRQHTYEGYSAQQSSFMVYLAKHLGAEAMILTTAGGIIPDKTGLKEYSAEKGDLVKIISYYPNFMESSLVGPISEEIGPRFVGSINTPDIHLGLIARGVYENSIGPNFLEVVYVPRKGPAFETPAEINMLSEMGSIIGKPILAGMSLVPEIEAANLVRVKSLAIGVVTNYCFNMAARREIETEFFKRHEGQFVKDGVASLTLSEGSQMIDDLIKARQPSHAEVQEAGNSPEVTKKLETLIGGTIEAIRI